MALINKELNYLIEFSRYVQLQIDVINGRNFDQNGMIQTKVGLICKKSFENTLALIRPTLDLVNEFCKQNREHSSCQIQQNRSTLELLEERIETYLFDPGKPFISFKNRQQGLPSHLLIPSLVRFRHFSTT